MYLYIEKKKPEVDKNVVKKMKFQYGNVATK